MAGAPMRIVLAGLILAVIVAAPPVAACSFDQTDDALAAELRRNDQVFVARFVEYREVPPQNGGSHGFNQVAWSLLETLKGHPPQSGKLVEMNPQLRAAGNPPGPSCGPFVVTRNNVGEDVLVLLSTRSGRRGNSWRPSWHSRPLLLNPEAGSAAYLQKVRDMISEEAQTP